MVVDSSPVVVTWTLDIAFALRKEFLDIQETRVQIHSETDT